jgi:hypothetical protein
MKGYYMVYIFAFIIIFIVQCIGMLLASWARVSYGGGIVFYFPTACIIYFAYGVLLNLLNIKFFHIRKLIFFLLIAISSAIILLSFFQVVGALDIFWGLLDDLIIKFWVIIFMADDDPLSVFVIGLINIPLFLICTFLSYIITVATVK